MGKESFHTAGACERHWVVEHIIRVINDRGIDNDTVALLRAATMLLQDANSLEEKAAKRDRAKKDPQGLFKMI